MGAWRLTSPASRLFTQPFIQVQIKKMSKPRVTGVCAGPVPGEFPAQRASNAENVSIDILVHNGCIWYINTLRPRRNNHHFCRRYIQFHSLTGTYFYLNSKFMECWFLMSQMTEKSSLVPRRAIARIWLSLMMAYFSDIYGWLGPNELTSYTYLTLG